MDDHDCQFIYLHLLRMLDTEDYQSSTLYLNILNDFSKCDQFKLLKHTARLVPNDSMTRILAYHATKEDHEHAERAVTFVKHLHRFDLQRSLTWKSWAKYYRFLA